MYFSEQGNVDDDATLITIFLVSFNLQSCCLMQSAVCSLQSAVCSLQSAVCSLQSAVCSLRSAVCSLRSAVCKCHTPPKTGVGACFPGHFDILQLQRCVFLHSEVADTVLQLPRKDNVSRQLTCDLIPISTTQISS